MLEGIFAPISSGITTVVAFLVVLTVVVFVHEYGHFIVARWCGVTVKAFSIGFGPELWAYVDRKGTRWRIAALPLGGYVKFLDDANAASAPSEEKLKELSPMEREGAFQTKPVWKRAAVVAAGPFANFILAAVLYALVNIFVGVRDMPAVITDVEPGAPAAEAGIKAGDRVVAIDGSSIDNLEELLRRIAMSPDKPLRLELERNGGRTEVNVTPTGREIKDSLGVTLRVGEIGIKSFLPARVGDVVPDLPAAKAGIKAGDVITAIDGTAVTSFDDLARIVNQNAKRELRITVDRDGQSSDIPITPMSWPRRETSGEIACVGRIGVSPAPTDPQPVGVVEAVHRGVIETADVLSQALSGLRDLVWGSQPLSQVGGPILMAEVTAKALDYGWERVIVWMAFFSANIGLLNLLPIPLLDGGHLLFYGVEAIRRRPLPMAVQEVFFKVGLAIVLTIMVIAFSNDISRKLSAGGQEPQIEEKKC